MNTKLNPVELVVELLKRSICAVQVAAVIADKHGVHAWGWNSSGATGMGMCAEAHALSRANPRRLAVSTIYIAARRKKSGSVVVSRPCKKCAQIVSKCQIVMWQDKSGDWLADFGSKYTSN